MMEKGKTLYWVKWVNQDTGGNIDSYFLATGLSQLEDNISDILELKVINDVHDLTNQSNKKVER